ncbi:hypothetical protein PHYPSEUDO_006598 [Phytophthora pseudosyringae]|uniref:Elicitin n=1 Tax=Phytophthora pseudosyringae TaxID=221518 RepID=A0A8T1VNG3_9STRA|nr:hypothetical protein PHYPSEUDO_006598 [Phytophthora pseudosyringae]
MSVPHSVTRVLLIVLLVTFSNAQDTQNAAFELAPIASAVPQSATFALVDGKSCDASVVTIVYELYAKNTMVFQTCVSEGQCKIFPFSGTHPTPQQIGALTRSLACRAIFSSLLLAGIPECELTNFPIRAVSETLLKVGVDLDKYPNSNDVVPSTDRFVEMMRWRRDANLAQAAGLPCDSSSKLYAEYTSNLNTVTTNALVRLTANKEVQYRPTIDGSFSQEQIVTMPNMPGLRGSGSGSKIMAVYTAEATVKPSSASSDAKETAKSSTSDAVSTSGAARISWSQCQVAAVVATLAMFVLA